MAPVDGGVACPDQDASCCLSCSVHSRVRPPAHGDSQMTDRMPPQADGLYDPRYEHDACGVAMVARLDNVPGHDVVDKALEALDNLEHRGAEGADVRTGDGAGLLLQLPARASSAPSSTSSCPSRGATASRLLPAARRDPPPPDRGAARAQRPRRGPARARLARRARSTRTHVGRHRQRLAPAHPPALRRGRARASSTTRTPSSASSTSSAASSSSPSAPTSTRRRSRAARSSTRGCSRRPSCAASTPTCRTSASPARWRSCTALLDEHLPELGARPPLPRDLPQRRDQHADGQRQLDARARVAARLRALRHRPAEGAAGRAPRRLGLGDLRQRARAAHARRALAAARGDDDDPGGLPGPRRPLRRAQGLLRLPLVPDGAVGRPGGGGLHQRPRRRRHARPQRPAPRALGRDQGRLRRPGLGDRDAQRAPGERQAPRAPAAGQDLPRRPRARAGSSRTRRSSARSPTQKPYSSVVRRARRALQRPPSARRASARPSCRCARASSPSATRRRTCACCTRRWRARARSRSARWATTPRSRSSPTSARRCSATSSSSSRRSPTRRSTPTRESIVMSLGTGVGAEGNLLDRDAPARPSARDGPADPAQRTSSRRCARSPPTSSARTRSTSRGRSTRARPGCRSAWPTCATRRPTTSRRGDQHPRSSPTAPPAPSARRSRRCWPSAPCTTTSCARARACARGSCSSPASRARSTTSPCSSATARARSTPTSCSTPSTSWPRDGRIAGVDDPDEAEKRIVKALGKGLLKTISKMGISTIQSYCGAQIFEAVGLEKTLIDRHFTGTASRIGGIGLGVLAREALDRHARAWPGSHEDLLPVGGVYAWRRDGEHHMWNPETIALLQHAVRGLNGTRAGEVRRVRRDGQHRRRAPGDAARAAGLPRRPRAGRRSRRSSRPRRSSSASPPARCRWARSPPRPTRRWPSP